MAGTSGWLCGRLTSGLYRWSGCGTFRWLRYGTDGLDVGRSDGCVMGSHVGISIGLLVT